jgi:hypothetical protein
MKQKSKTTQQVKDEFAVIVKSVYDVQNKNKGLSFGKDKAKIDKDMLDGYIKDKLDNKLQDVFSQIDILKV